MSVAIQLIEMIRGATSEDVAAVDAEIGRLKSELDRLRMVREIIAPKQHKPHRQAYNKFGGKNKSEEFRRNASAYIALHGPKTAAHLAGKCSYSKSTANSVLNLSPLFARLADGTYDLTNEGRAALASRQEHANNGTTA
jgi:hypothetical protein